MGESDKDKGNLEREFVHGLNESHKHTLRYIEDDVEPHKCNGCKMPGSSQCFKCVDPVCHFYLHYHCFAAEDTVRHELLGGCDYFDYHKTPPRVSDYGGDYPYCDACGLDILGYRYQCDTKSHLDKPHDLHPTCAYLPLEMKLGDLKLHLKDNVESKCLHCNERYPAESCTKFTGWKWVAKKKKYWGYPSCIFGRKICFHVKCMNEMLAPGSGLCIRRCDTSSCDYSIISAKVTISKLTHTWYHTKLFIQRYINLGSYYFQCWEPVADTMYSFWSRYEIKEYNMGFWYSFLYQ